MQVHPAIENKLFGLRLSFGGLEIYYRRPARLETSLTANMRELNYLRAKELQLDMTPIL